MIPNDSFQNPIPSPPSPSRDPHEITPEIVPPPRSDARIKLCHHHSLPLQIYCESCEEPICRNCSLLGPHNTQLHRLASVSEAYLSLSQELSDFIKSNLLEKKELLLAQIYRIEYRIEEILHVKTAIERDVRKEYSETLENLKYGEGEKVAILEKEIHELQKDLDLLNDLGNYFLEISTSNADPMNFILNSRNVYERLQYLISKPFKSLEKHGIF